jgi:hypothetical protein
MSPFAGTRFRSPQHWRNWIDQRALRQLQRLIQRGLWDGTPPVPVDHVLEQNLQLTISVELVQEPVGTRILGCLRPAARMVVLNEVHRELFERVPGTEAWTKGHEAGHADCYALADLATEQGALLGLGTYAPWHGQATRGPVQAVCLEDLNAALRGQPRAVRTAVYESLRADERVRVQRGEDTPLERRTVDRYAAALLMPEDLMRRVVGHRQVCAWNEVYDLAELFGVSVEAMKYRLIELGLAAPPVGPVSAATAAGQGELDLV